MKIKGNLNEGIGEPCAGHDNPRALPSSRSKVVIFDSTENFGAEPPIGSTNIDSDQCLKLLIL